MTAPQNPRVTQADEEWAEEVASAANIVTNGGYYEIDIDAVTLVIARHREAAEAASKAREAALVEALDTFRFDSDADVFRLIDRLKSILTPKEPEA